MSIITTKQDILNAGGFMSEADFMGGKLSVVEFESISSLAKFDYCLREREDAAYAPRHNSWRYGSAEGFLSHEASAAAIFAGRCPDSVMELYRAMRDAIEPNVIELLATMPSAKRKRVSDVVGDELDIDKLMTGDPMHWVKRIRGQKKMAVKIAISFVYSAGTGEAEFVRGAVRGIALADVLSRLGHAVEIVAVGFSMKAEGDRYAVVAPLKKSTQPMDPQAMLICCLPSLSRTHTFGIWDVYGRDSVGSGGRSGVTMHLDRVGQEYVDYFGFDIFATGEDFRYMGPDAESHIAQVVSNINAAIIAPVKNDEIAAMEALFSSLTAPESA